MLPSSSILDNSIYIQVHSPLTAFFLLVCTFFHPTFFTPRAAFFYPISPKIPAQPKHCTVDPIAGIIRFNDHTIDHTRLEDPDVTLVSSKTLSFPEIKSDTSSGGYSNTKPTKHFASFKLSFSLLHFNDDLVETFLPGLLRLDDGTAQYLLYPFPIHSLGRVLTTFRFCLHS